MVNFSKTQNTMKPEIIATFVQYILEQSQKQHGFDINHVKQADINNGNLYIVLVDGERIVISLSYS